MRVKCLKPGLKPGLLDLESIALTIGPPHIHKAKIASLKMDVWEFGTFLTKCLQIFFFFFLLPKILILKKKSSSANKLT